MPKNLEPFQHTPGFYDLDSLPDFDPDTGWRTEPGEEGGLIVSELDVVLRLIKPGDEYHPDAELARILAGGDPSDGNSRRLFAISEKHRQHQEVLHDRRAKPSPFDTVRWELHEGDVFLNYLNVTAALARYAQRADGQLMVRVGNDGSDTMVGDLVGLTAVESSDQDTAAVVRNVRGELGVVWPSDRDDPAAAPIVVYRRDGSIPRPEVVE